MRYLGPLIFLALSVFGAWRWRRSALRVPRFVHILAILGLALGVWMAWLDTTIDEFTWGRSLLEVGVMPVLVYLGFFAYSGRLREERENELPPPDDHAAA